MITQTRIDCKRGGKKENAESAENPQNTQTGWECGDNANYVSYATIPARLLII